ncbi:uncharacterized protein [Eurosta solidaginis]|uniref:uncharacterized protein isoform X2 n=1 Tax=Eurosta solidaginis TaxID=178769 RepID=UPI00353135D8
MAPRLNKKQIFTYFNLIDDGAIAVCKMCNHNLKSDRLFNLKTHLSKLHKIKYSGDNNESCGSGSGVVKKEFRKKIIKIPICHKQLLRSYIGLIIEDNMPFHVLDSENMKNIIDPICEGISLKYEKKFDLNSHKCKILIKLMASNIRDEIREELEQRLISLKIVSATRLSHNNSNKYTLSAQYVQNYVIQSKILGIIELESTTQDISTEIMKVLNKYGISFQQIVTITLDNRGDSIFKAGAEDAEESNDVYLKNIEILNETSKIEMENIEICRCASKTAQLCALDSTKDATIRNYLMNCRNLIKYIRNPTNGLHEFFAQNKLALPQLDCTTKYGSTYNMMADILNAKTVLVNIANIKHEISQEKFVINDELWFFIKSYYTIYEPLQKTIIKFQEEELHYYDLYAQWLKCKILTEKLVQISPDSLSQLIGNNLLNNIEHRTSQLLTNECVNACLYLDPRFNHILSAHKRADAIVFLKKIYDRLKEMGGPTECESSSIKSENCMETTSSIKSEPCMETTSSIKSEHCMETTSSIKSEKSDSTYNTLTVFNAAALEDEDDYVNEYLCQNLEARNADHTDVYSKIENLKLPFQRVNTNILEFWKERESVDPELYALSNICFAIPTQSLVQKLNHR